MRRSKRQSGPLCRISLKDQIDVGTFSPSVRYHARVIAKHARQVSSFVKEYGEHAAVLINETLNGSGNAGPGTTQARILVDSLGKDSARLLPAFIDAYYTQTGIDIRA